MPFITTPERVGYRGGLRKCIELLLRVRFGEEGLQLMPEIREIHEEAKLEAITTTLGTAASPDEVRRLWSPGTRRMPFVTTPERVGYRRGLRTSIDSLLRVRFGEEGLGLMPEVEEIHEEEKLEAILKALETAASLDEVCRLWSQ